MTGSGSDWPLVFEPICERGDVFHSASDRRRSRLIRWAGREADGPAEVNHSGLVVEGGPIRECVVIEAVGRIRKVRIGDAYRPDERITVWRPLNIPPDDLEVIIAAAEADVGKRYPWEQLLLHLADAAIPGRPVLFRRFAGVSGRYVCSASLGVWFATGGYTYGSANPAALSPDDIHDYNRTHPRHWAMRRDLLPLGGAQ